MREKLVDTAVYDLAESWLPKENDMGNKRAADDATVRAFISAVFPNAPDLALAAFDEQHVLKTATTLISDLRRELAMERCPFGSDDVDECGCHSHKELRAVKYL